MTTILFHFQRLALTHSRQGHFIKTVGHPKKGPLNFKEFTKSGEIEKAVDDEN